MVSLLLLFVYINDGVRIALEFEFLLGGLFAIVSCSILLTAPAPPSTTTLVNSITEFFGFLLLFRLLFLLFLLLLLECLSLPFVSVSAAGGGVLPLIKFTPLLKKFETELINPEDALPDEALPSVP